MYSINDLTLEEVQLILKALKEYQTLCETVSASPYSSEEIIQDYEKAKQLLNKLNK